MALTSQLDLMLTMTESANPLDFEAPVTRVVYSKALALASGTGAGQADVRWSDQRTLTAGTNEDVDLACVQSGTFGGLVTFASIKGLIIFAAVANTVALTVSRPATTGAHFFAADGDAVVLNPGGMLVLWNPAAAGYTVTAGTDDMINVAAGAGSGSQVYDIHVIGDSA